MKITQLIAIAVLAFGITFAQAGEKVTAGAKGGRLLENDSPRAEFFVEKDRTVSLTFYGNDMKPVPVSDQSATAIAETKDGKKKIEFEKKATCSSRSHRCRMARVTIGFAVEPDT